MKIGYARVSTEDQNLELQLDELKKFGCDKIFQEKISGSSKDRPELEKLLEHLREGDTVVVWKLDRLGRSLKDLIFLIEGFKERGIGFVSLKDPIDTTTAAGELTFLIFGALAQFERRVISERTKAGLKAARARGKKGGRPKGLSPEAKEKARVAKILHKDTEMSIPAILKQLNISRASFYKYLKM